MLALAVATTGQKPPGIETPSAKREPEVTADELERARALLAANSAIANLPE